MTPEEKRKYAAGWRAKNREKCRAYNAKWRVAQTEVARAAEKVRRHAHYLATADEAHEYYMKTKRLRDPEKQRAAQAAYRARHAEKIKARRRDLYRLNAKKLNAERQVSRLKREYGLTEAMHAQMVAAQAGRCAICWKPPKWTKPLAVDHDHATGRVRGLLCVACNTALGLFEDNTVALQTAIAYLQGGKRPWQTPRLTELRMA